MIITPESQVHNGNRQNFHPWILTATGGGAQVLDLSEVREALAVLVDPGHGVQLCGIPSGQRIIVPGRDAEAFIHAAEKLVASNFIYLTPNPVPPELPGNAKVGDILRRRWLQVDIDPIRPNTKVSATDAEHAAAFAKANVVREWLASEAGWPEPVMIDTGNGYQMLYRVDLANDTAARDLCVNCLRSLALRFGDSDGARVDKETYKANQNVKLPGTWSRKGPSTAERPHRPVRMVHVPESVEIVPMERIVALAGMAPGKKVLKQTPPRPPADPWKMTATSGYGCTAYARAVLEGELRTLASTLEGGRHIQAYKSAAVIGNYLVSGSLSRDEVEERLFAAALEIGLPDGEARKAVTDGLAKGESDPKEIPERLAERNGADWHRGDAWEGPDYPVAGELAPDAPNWPSPPSADAYYGLAGDIVRRIEPSTEADPIAILVQLLVALGSVIGRNAYFQVESKRHYLNLYAILVGRTAKGRKGMALSWVERILGGAADQTWLDSCQQTGLSSGEGLIAAVRDPIERVNRDGEVEIIEQGAKDKRLFIVEEEFSTVLRMAARDGNILSGVIRQAWDCGRLRTLTRHSPLRATDAYVSIVGHITQEELTRLLTKTDAANGFANRFLWICVRRSKLLPDGGFNLYLEDLQNKLKQAVCHAVTVKEMRRDATCAQLWRAKYPYLSREIPGLLGLLASRAEAQVLRLSCVYALFNCSAVVRAEHLRAALALWEYVERSCRYIFGEPDGPALEKLLGDLRTAGANGLNLTEISKIFGGHKKGEEIKGLLATLASRKLVVPGRSAVGGKPAENWKAAPECANPANPANAV